MAFTRGKGKNKQNTSGGYWRFLINRKTVIAFVAGYCLGEMLVYIHMSGSVDDTFRNPMKVSAYLMLMPVFIILNMFGLLNPAPEYIGYIAPGAFYGFAAVAMIMLVSRSSRKLDS